jgi:seryl-tRNA synthetase
MDDKKEVAVGSFNYHGMHFSTAFNIRLANHEYAFTVCIAYGLERLAYLFITQKGLEKSTEILKNYIRQNI